VPSLESATTQFGVYGGPLRRGGDFLDRVPATDLAVTDTFNVSLVDATPVIDALATRPGYTQTFTKFGPYGGPLTASTDFTKVTVTLAELNVTDTWLSTLTEDPVDENQIVGTDEWRMSVADIATLRNNLAVTDTLGVQSIENIGLLQAGVVLQSVTDTWSVTFTEGVGDVRVTLAVTDTLSTQFNMATPTLAFPLELKAVTDDFNVALSGEVAGLQIFVGVVPLNAFDTWNVTLSTEGAEFTVQQPIGRIAFRVLTNKIRFEFV
jgi:hypothetical protein